MAASIAFLHMLLACFVFCGVECTHASARVLALQESITSTFFHQEPVSFVDCVHQETNFATSIFCILIPRLRNDLGTSQRPSAVSQMLLLQHVMQLCLMLCVRLSFLRLFDKCRLSLFCRSSFTFPTSFNSSIPTWSGAAHLIAASSSRLNSCAFFSTHSVNMAPFFFPPNLPIPTSNNAAHLVAT